MQFAYFAASKEHMRGLLEGTSVCSICGREGTCFSLEWAIEVPGREGNVGCVDCLQAGRFEFWHDTEIGFLDEKGLSQEYREYKEVPRRFSPQAIETLRRTPGPVTWQDENWLVHCDDFMVYQGVWTPEDFNEHSPTGDGRSLFLEMTDPPLDYLWDSCVTDGSPLREWWATYYAFRCRHCGKLRGNWDCD